MRILLVSRNLMTRVQLESRWRAAGATVTDSLDETADLIVLDLAETTGETAVDALKARHPHARLIAFGPHVDGAAFRDAKAAGADECVARGSVIERVLARIGRD